MFGATLSSSERFVWLKGQAWRRTVFLSCPLLSTPVHRSSWERAGL